MRLERKLLLVRGDANAQIGTGHLMRCLALAQSWRDQGGRVMFITACKNETLRRRLADESVEVVPVEQPHPDPSDWQSTASVLVEHPGAWIVLDGYHFDPTYQLRIKEAGHPLLVIDDMAHLHHYSADIVLNQNPHAHDLKYSCEPYTRVLCGTKYVLLRREFLKWKGWKRDIPEVAHKVLVTMGGSDSANVTLKVIQALQQVDLAGLEVVVVVGGANENSYEELESLARDSNILIRLKRKVTNMPDLMAWADVAVTAGGSTCWELAFMGLPALILILAENQRPVAEGLETEGIGVNLGIGEKLDRYAISRALEELLRSRTTRATMSCLGQRLVDSHGPNRVLECLQFTHVLLRRACEDDCELLWNWTNEPHTRSVSFLPGPITWKEHSEWFRTKLAEPGCYFYIATDQKGQPIGQARYDLKGSEAVVSISVDYRFRGKGYGRALLSLSAQELARVKDVTAIHAHIKANNDVSIRAFESAGYRHVDNLIVGGEPAVHLVLSERVGGHSDRN